MKIVLDVNVIISALIKNSITREILVKSEHEFYFPTNAKKKLKKYEELILNKSGLTKSELETVMKGIFSNINLVADEKLQEQKKEAEKIMGHIDSEDTLFIATALTITDANIWSDDKHFEEQKTIHILKTKELVELYKKQ